VHVGELWRYPVKSMVGERVDRIDIDAGGVVGDRTWATRDEVRGGIRGAKKIKGLMAFRARYDGEGSAVIITTPTGEDIHSDDADRDARLSAALGHEVTLWPLQPAADLDHYRRGAPDNEDMMEELRAVFGREADEPLPDLGVFPPEVLEFESPPGTYLDAYPLMIMSTSALNSIAAAVPESVVDVRRFRPGLVIDTGDAEGHPEFDWVGRTMTVGGAVLEIGAPCPRCVMVTHAVGDDVPADRAVLRHIVRELDQNVGVYATVVTPGTVTTGDTVTLT
jgi:uncharacterized protein YcbX